MDAFGLYRQEMQMIYFEKLLKKVTKAMYPENDPNSPPHDLSPSQNAQNPKDSGENIEKCPET